MAGEMNYSLADLRAAMGDGDGFGSGNNGFLWLLFLWAMMGGNFNGNRCGCGEFLSKVGVDAASANQIDDLSRQVTQDALRGAIAGNHDAIDALSKQLCCSTADITAAISGVNQAILETSAKTDLSIANLGTQIALGNQSILTKLGECCCNIRTEMLQGFNGVDKNMCDFRNSMNLGFSGINASIERGFSNLGFLAEKNTNDIIQAGHADTDRVLQAMSDKTIAELRDRAAKAEVEISQRDQSAYILSQIKNGCGCNNNCGGCC